MAAVEEGPLGAIKLDVEGGAGAWAAAGGSQETYSDKANGALKGLLASRLP